MQRTTLTAAQQRWLEQELSSWQLDAIVTPDQAKLIRGRYESADEISERKRSVAVQALFGMAAFLFGLAVLLLIGFNWNQLGRELKLVIVLGVVTTTHLGAFRLRQTGKHLALSEVISLLGCLLYGAGIWLVAQAFHLEAHYPDGVWWWAVGVLPFALCLDSLMLHLLFVSLVALWGGMEVFGFAHLTPWWLMGWFDFPNGAYSLPLLAAPGLILAYQRKSPLIIALYVPLLAWWAVLLAFALHLDARSVFWIGNVGAILILFAESHRPRDPRGVPYRFWGVLMVAGVLLTLGSLGFWRSMNHLPDWYGDRYVIAMLTEVIASLILLGVSIGILFFVRGIGAFDLKGEASEPDSIRRRWFAIILVGSLMLMAVWSLTISDAATSSTMPIIVANLVTIGMALYLLKVGEQEERTRPFAAGVLMFLMWALVRYIDLFGAAGGMLGAAVVFALCSGGLVVVANFWSRKRRSLQESTTPRQVESLTTPVWVNSAIGWLDSHRAPILISTAIAQVGLLGGMILIESLPLMIGERIVLKVTPIDPRDFFRGDYVILNYDINRLPVPGQTTSGTEWNVIHNHYDETVYVPLERDADGNHWTGKTASLSKPAAGKYLRGRVSMDYRQPLQFGIEAYYVQEGQGKVLEDLQNSHKLSAEIAVAPWGQAKLVRMYSENP
jgi:uncharacterized membrane protein/uncharacterized membrane-anchored protein